MILLPKKVAILFFLLFTFSIIALGLYGYGAIQDSGYPESGGKVEAERFLYIAIVGCSIIIIVFLFFAGRTLHISRELDKMIDLNKRGDFSPELSMKKLGRIGEQITLLYFSLNALNEKKGLKISALSGLVELLVDNLNSPLLVTDVQGTIVYVNRLFTEKLELNRAEIMNRNIGNVLPDAPFRDTVLELDKTNTPIELTDLKTPFTLFGVQNRKNELSYVLWLVEKAALLASNRQPAEIAGNRQGLMTRMFRRNANK
ncbi:MAG: PAS domain-containing protein [Spirochaetales bacterium]|jgi:PAS domain-containing protein|nr:PAS domain-containing protein [Spirochaetales bacterium]